MAFGFPERSRSGLIEASTTHPGTSFSGSVFQSDPALASLKQVMQAADSRMQPWIVFQSDPALASLKLRRGAAGALADLRFSRAIPLWPH